MKNAETFQCKDKYVILSGSVQPFLLLRHLVSFSCPFLFALKEKDNRRKWDTAPLICSKEWWINQKCSTLLYRVSSNPLVLELHFCCCLSSWFVVLKKLEKCASLSHETSQFSNLADLNTHIKHTVFGVVYEEEWNVSAPKKQKKSH